MLEGLRDAQARITEIQSRIDALQAPAPLAPPASAATGRPAPPAFPETLDRARSDISPTPGIPATPPGALPPLPVSPTGGNIVPIRRAGDFDTLIQAYADKRGLDPSLVRAVIQTESGGDPQAVSRVGALGLMQLMPENVKEAGIANPFDPEQNIAAGTQQLAGLLNQYHGDLDLALAGYNAGPGNVRKYGGIPPFHETQDYIRKVRAAMNRG